MFHALDILQINSFVVCKHGDQGDPEITHKSFCRTSSSLCLTEQPFKFTKRIQNYQQPNSKQYDNMLHRREEEWAILNQNCLIIDCLETQRSTSRWLQMAMYKGPVYTALTWNKKLKLAGVTSLVLRKQLESIQGVKIGFVKSTLMYFIHKIELPLPWKHSFIRG